TGNLSCKNDAPFVHAHVALSRETDNGIEVLGGHLVDGGVFASEPWLACADDLGPRRDRGAATGLSLWVGSSTPLGRGRDAMATEDAHDVVPAPAAAGAISWAQVAQASDARPAPRPQVARAAGPEPRVPVMDPTPLPERRRVTEEEFLEERIPERGDFIDHQQFGRCRVEGEDSNGSLLIKLPSGRRKAIRLDV